MFQVIFIGTGGGAPSKRGLPAYLMKKDNFTALLDCGEGTQLAMIRNSLNVMSIKLVAITHLHADHVLGLPPLIQTMSMYGRKEKLYVMGPPGIKELLEESFELTFFKPDFPLEFVDELTLGEIHVTPFRTCHVVPSQGYLIQERDSSNLDVEKLRREGINDWRIMRTLKEGKEVHWEGRTLRPEDYLIKRRGLRIAYTGDTRPCNEVIRAVRGVDLLLHDSTFEAGVNAGEYGHSTSVEAAEVAKEAEVRRLALIHISSRYRDATELVKQAKRVFPMSFAPSDLSFLNLRQG
ncbi:MAG: ribonuclease Z [Metallosphaera yellowstonensis]|jgi:ribonuclease Z|uniref:Ribonuclease Z n=1 Tax=Metallosphaera yellowstonensis MK1 TaxID=671065 RepID=H2C8N4_9CREN|nr:ribonuclease Z [Metallosphaera yellowstonensis]EHP68510.1 ribonuclease Z [Metallosphaera yellowstonensis MK1]